MAHVDSIRSCQGLSVNPMYTLVLKTICLFALFKEHDGAAQGARSSQAGNIYI